MSLLIVISCSILEKINWFGNVSVVLLPEISLVDPHYDYIGFTVLVTL